VSCAKNTVLPQARVTLDKYQGNVGQQRFT